MTTLQKPLIAATLTAAVGTGLYEARPALAKSNQPDEQSEAEPEDTPECRTAYAKMNDAKVLVLGWLLYASDNENRLPSDLNQTTNYWAKSEHQPTGTNQFELVVQGSLKGIANPMETVVIREKEPSFFRGGWVKTYGFADGHAEIKKEPPQGFEAWESNT